MDIQKALERAVSELRAWATNNFKLKVDKEEGKGLSTNDFTNDQKTKLDNIQVSNVSFSQTLSSGTKIGAINIDGKNTNIFAPVHKITDSLVSNDSNTALSAAAGKNLQDQINGTNKDLNTQNNRLNTLSNSVTDINNEQNVQDSNILKLSQDITNTNTELNNQKADITDLSNAINGINSEVDNLTSFYQGHLNMLEL